MNGGDQSLSFEQKLKLLEDLERESKLDGLSWVRDTRKAVYESREQQKGWEAKRSREENERFE